MKIDLEKYLDVVWVSGGRVFPELDCYGVVNEVRRDLGLPAWDEHAGATRDDLPELAQRAVLQHAGSDLVEGAVAFCYEGSMAGVPAQGRLRARLLGPGRCRARLRRPPAWARCPRPIRDTSRNPAGEAARVPGARVRPLRRQRGLGRAGL